MWRCALVAHVQVLVADVVKLELFSCGMSCAEAREAIAYPWRRCMYVIKYSSLGSIHAKPEVGHSEGSVSHTGIIAFQVE